MIGNEFLKYPPHKNTGLPQAEYNLMRLQMGMAKIPYMRRELSGGVLTVKKIFNTEYKATWSPSGGEISIDYMVRYRDVGGEDRVKFFDKDWGEVCDVLLDDIIVSVAEPYGRGILDIDSIEFQVTDDLICVCEYSDSNPYVFYFYSIGIGRLADNLAIPIDYADKVKWVWAEHGSFYIYTEWHVGDWWTFKVKKITPSFNDVTKVYTFTEDIIVFYDGPSIYPDGALPHYPRTRMPYVYCENGVIYDHRKADLIPEVTGFYINRDVIIKDINTGNTISEIQGGPPGNPDNGRWYGTPTLYMDIQNAGETWIKTVPFGTNEVTDSPWERWYYYYEPKPVQHENGRGMYAFFHSDPRWIVYTRTGEEIASTDALNPSIGGHSHYTSQLGVDWQGTALPKTLLCFPSNQGEEGGSVIGWESGGSYTVSTIQELYAFLNLPADTQYISEVNYLPHMERDPILNEFLVKRTIGG